MAQHSKYYDDLDEYGLDSRLPKKSLKPQFVYFVTPLNGKIVKLQEVFHKQFEAFAWLRSKLRGSKHALSHPLQRYTDWVTKESPQYLGSTLQVSLIGGAFYLLTRRRTTLFGKIILTSASIYISSLFLFPCFRNRVLDSISEVSAMNKISRGLFTSLRSYHNHIVDILCTTWETAEDYQQKVRSYRKH